MTLQHSFKRDEHADRTPEEKVERIAKSLEDEIYSKRVLWRPQTTREVTLDHRNHNAEEKVLRIK